ncbi:hypothetical protein F5Y05DRAFT_257527 [Hypoxylon sp. FL0543]|nr:hypothetical protein F5Y05DRAFT_257527 [Hypoxylon sp. FL0543]
MGPAQGKLGPTVAFFSALCLPCALCLQRAIITSSFHVAIRFGFQLAATPDYFQGYYLDWITNIGLRMQITSTSLIDVKEQHAAQHRTASNSQWNNPLKNSSTNNLGVFFLFRSEPSVKNPVSVFCSARLPSDARGRTLVVWRSCLHCTCA